MAFTTPIDPLDRDQAWAGNEAFLSKPAQLLMWHQREVWRRFHQVPKPLQTATPVIGVAQTFEPPPMNPR